LSDLRSSEPTRFPTSIEQDVHALAARRSLDRKSRSFHYAYMNQFFVMAGLVPAIHVVLAVPKKKTWMPGTRPGMTAS